MIFEAIDLSKVPGSLSNTLAKELRSINKLSADEIMEMLKKAIKDSKISPAKSKEVLDIASKYKNNKNRLMKYIADLVLAGAGHAVVSELEDKFAEIYGKNEFIIKSIISSSA